MNERQNVVTEALRIRESLMQAEDVEEEDLRDFDKTFNEHCKSRGKRLQYSFLATYIERPGFWVFGAVIVVLGLSDLLIRYLR